MREWSAKNLEEWAKTQRRVTNKRIRDEFGVDEDRADVGYLYLKTAGIIEAYGYVSK